MIYDKSPYNFANGILLKPDGNFQVIQNKVTLDDIKINSTNPYYRHIILDKYDLALSKKLSDLITEIKGATETRRADFGDINIDRYISAVIPTLKDRKRAPDLTKVFDKTKETNELKIIILVDGTGSTLGSEKFEIMQQDGTVIKYQHLNEFLRKMCMILNQALKPHKDLIDFEFWVFRANSPEIEGQFVYIEKFKNVTNEDLDLIFPLDEIRLGVHHIAVNQAMIALREEVDRKTLILFLTDGLPEYSRAGLDLLHELQKSLNSLYNRDIEFFILLALTNYYSTYTANEIKTKMSKVAKGRIYSNEVQNKFDDFQTKFLRTVREFVAKINES